VNINAAIDSNAFAPNMNSSKSRPVGRRFDFLDLSSSSLRTVANQPTLKAMHVTASFKTVLHHDPAQSAILPTYARADVTFERGEGVWMVASNGDRYLDFGAGIAVNALGHAHPHLVEALTNQAQKLWHTSNLFQMPDGERFARRLTEASFADRVFFTNSGAEANECAIKMARKYHAANGEPERYRILTFEGAFHGRTLATIAAGGQAKYLDGFGPKVDGFDQVAFGDHEAIDRAITLETAAIMVEPIQGEGGIRALPKICLKGLRQICDAKGLLLIFDEVQTGIGRTGKFFAHEWAGVTPDILTSAKGIGGGFPMGACLATEEAAKGMTQGVHGTTFGGNQLAMAVGNAVLDIVLADGFLDRVSQAGLLLRQRLAELQDRFPDVIEEVRGEGLLLGLKTLVTPAEFAAALRAEKLVTIPAGDNVVRFLPPLIISDSEILDGVRRVEAACTILSAKLKTGGSA
jgi:acetylornithine/N-succinyldiaminopimelate aminotransferase